GSAGGAGEEEAGGNAVAVHRVDTGLGVVVGRVELVVAHGPAVAGRALAAGVLQAELVEDGAAVEGPGLAAVLQVDDVRRNVLELGRHVLGVEVRRRGDVLVGVEETLHGRCTPGGNRVARIIVRDAGAGHGGRGRSPALARGATF